MKKLISTICICIIMTTNCLGAQQSSPKVAAKGAVLMDMESGRVLWGKNEDEPMTMASTTKIMTAIIALENGKMDDVVTVSKRAASAAEVKMHLQTGETHRLEDLIYAMMLKSYNDAAVAVAEHVGGSVENFCQMMTEKAKEIGAKDTVFASPNGLDSTIDFSQHHSTAYDMALITRYALNNEEFVKIINTKEVTIPLKGGSDKSYYIPNADKFLNIYEGAFGVKTGYTNKAGQCFVGAVKRNDIKLISVVLASGWGTAGKEQKWKDTKSIMDYGFENYEIQTIVDKNTKLNEIIAIEGSKTKKIGVKLGNSMTLVVHKEGTEKVDSDISYTSVLNAPVKEGQKVGEARITVNGQYINSIPLLADGSAEPYSIKKSFETLKNKWFHYDLKEISGTIKKD